MRLISKIDRKKAMAAAGFLGLPYAAPRFYRAERKKTGWELWFTPETEEALKLYIGRGCPAGQIAISGVYGRNLLQEYWGRITEYLIPEDATAEENLDQILAN